MQMQRLDLNVSPAMQPHLDKVMPPTGQVMFEIIAGAFVVYSIYWFIKEAMNTKSYYPIMFFLGAALCFFCEPLYDLGMTAIYPHEGQRVVVELLGRKMPFYIILSYLGFLPVFFAIAGNLIEKGVSSKTIIWAYAAMAVGTIAVEIPAIHVGLWSYYGNHKLYILNYPPMIGFTNGIAYLLCAVAYMKFKPILTGNKQVLGVLIIPVVFTMGEFGVGWPLFSVINTAGAVENHWLAFAGILGTLVLIAAVIWTVCFAVAVDKRRVD